MHHDVVELMLRVIILPADADDGIVSVIAWYLNVPQHIETVGQLKTWQHQLASETEVIPTQKSLSNDVVIDYHGYNSI